MKASTRKAICDVPEELIEKAAALYEKFTAPGFVPVRAWFEVCKLFSEKAACCRQGYDHVRVPAQDHARGFRNPRTGERVFTIQPYFGVSEEGQPVISTDHCRTYMSIPDFTTLCEKFARERGLTVKVSFDGWHRPDPQAIRCYCDGLSELPFDAVALPR